MKLAATCISPANKQQINAGIQLNFQSAKANAQPIITGVMAPASVLGRAASIHACNELRFTSSIFFFYHPFLREQR